MPAARAVHGGLGIPLWIMAALFVAVPQIGLPGPFGPDNFDGAKLALMQFGALVALLLMLWLRWGGSAAFRPWAWWLLPAAFAALMFARAMFMPVPILGLREAARVLSFVLLAWIAFQIADDKNHRILPGAIFVGGVLQSVVALLQFSGVFFLYYVHFHQRFAGFFGDPNCLCAFLNFSFWGGVYTTWKAETRVGRALAAAGTLLTAFGIVLTYSRSGWLCFAFSLAVFFALFLIFMKEQRRRAALFIVVMAAAAIAGGALTHRFHGEINAAARVASIGRFFHSESEGRVGLWKAAVHIGTRRPITGSGPGTFYFNQVAAQIEMLDSGAIRRAYIRAYHAYNDYLEIFSETGYPGLALYVACLAGLFIACVVRIGRDRERRPLLITLTAGMASLPVGHTAFQFPFYNTMAMASLAVFAGMALGAGKARARPAVVRPAPRMALVLATAALFFTASYFCIAPLTAGLYYLKGFSLNKSGMHEEALPWFRTSTALNRANYLNHYYHGVALMELGRYREARAAFLEAARYFPTMDAIWLHLAGVDIELRDKPAYERHIGLYRKYQMNEQTEM